MTLLRFLVGLDTMAAASARRASLAQSGSPYIKALCALFTIAGGGGGRGNCDEGGGNCEGGGGGGGSIEGGGLDALVQLASGEGMVELLSTLSERARPLAVATAVCCGFVGGENKDDNEEEEGEAGITACGLLLLAAWSALAAL